MVFSSATPNNPASMFGHTFMKINSNSSRELLDWGINFAAAVADDENPFAFMAFGVAGGYYGQFSMLPYFEKVNEYTNSESRDLWEYELSLTPEETRHVLMHLWELETNGYFAYYFFDENCSYQLLAVIEAVKPEWNLTEFPIYVIPGESIKKLTDIDGAIKRVKFRPSLQKQMRWAYEKLNHEERDAFHQISQTRNGVSRVQSARLLNALALNYMYTRHQSFKQKASPEDLAYQSELLVRRSQFNVGDMVEIAETPSETRPDLGHDSYRIGVWGGAMSRPTVGQGFLELSWKSAYQDLLNKDLGFSRLSHIDFPGIDFRYNFKDSFVSIEKITGIATTSIFPLSLVEKRLSWKFEGFSYNPKDFGCDYCHVLHAAGGVGASLEVFTRDVVAFAMLAAQFEGGDSFERGFRYGPGIDVGVVWINSDLKIMWTGQHWWDLDQKVRYARYLNVQFDASYSLSRNWEMRAGLQKLLHFESSNSDYDQVQFKLNKYFN